MDFLWLLLLTVVSHFLQFCGASIHLTLARRGGRFARHEPANLTTLSDILRSVEAQYARTHREVDGNRLVRRWTTSGSDDTDDYEMLASVGHHGLWYAAIEIGNPPQTLEFDLSMLNPDLYTIMTTSDKGIKYDTFASGSHVPNDERVHPICRKPSDLFRIGTQLDAPRLVFAMCVPSKSSRHTLLHSGSVLGLGPSGTLSRLSIPSMIDQLAKMNDINEAVWSITLLDTESGILTLGGTAAKEMEGAKIGGEIELSHFGDSIATPEWVNDQVEQRLRFSMSEELPMEEHFKWTDVRGAAGWWTALMAGVWINGAKVLKNQPILLDLQCPFILAPPLAAHRFYEAIGGAKRLQPPYDNFFAYPCLNRVNIAFEIGGWNFPSMGGEGTRTDGLHGPPGGRFSLGKVGRGTGYCIGSVVETRMGIQKGWARSGVQDMWVLGEPFFRGLGVVFDAEKGKIGVRTY